MKKILFLLLLFGTSFSELKAQINFDFTDSLVNQQKQYIIRFDVANGNIYLPVKKKTKINFSELSLFKKDVIKLKDSINVPLYKDTILNGKVTKWQYNFQKIENPALDNSKKNNNLIRYLVAGRYFKPSVGTFIRLVFDNVPKNMDIGVEADFLDKNLENASTFEGFLNKYATTLDTAVNRDVKSLNQEKNVEEIKKTVDSSTKVLKDSIEGFKRNVDDVIKTINQIKSTLDKYNTGPKVTNMDSKTNLDKTNIQMNLVNKWVDSLKKLNIDTAKIDKINIDDTLKIPDLKSILNLLEGNVRTIVNLNRDAAKVAATLNEKLISVNILSQRLDKSKDSISKLIEIIRDLKKEQDSIHKRHDSISSVLYDSIYNRRTIYIQPIQVPNNDISLLKITYKTSNSPDKNIYREVMLKNRYGFKLDFSTGFIGTGLLDDSYRIVPTPNTVRDTASIVADSKGSFAIGFALMAHAYMRTGGRVNLAINTGLMLNGSNQTVNYLTGISLPLGLEQRFVISTGIAYGKVKRLTSGFATNTPYPSTTLNLSSGVPYTEKWQNSWYLGVSYNLSSLTATSRKTVIAR